MSSHILSLNLLLPVLGILMICTIPRNHSLIIRRIALIATGLQAWIAVQLLLNFDYRLEALQMVEHVRWIDALNIDFFLAIDGLNLVFIILSAIIFFTGAIITEHSISRPTGFFSLYLLTDFAIMGLVSGLDMLLILCFTGIAIFAFFLLLAIWTETTEDIAAGQFALTGIFSFMVILAAALLLHYDSALKSFVLPELIHGAHLTLSQRTILLILTFCGLAPFIPVFPFHFHLRPALRNVPVSLKMVLTCIFAQIGIYYLLRFGQVIFPGTQATLVPLLAALGTLNIVYGAIQVTQGDDLDAWTVPSTLIFSGLALLGIAAAVDLSVQSGFPQALGLTGALFNVFNHGVLLALFLVICYLQNKPSDAGSDRHLPLLFVGVPVFAASFLPGLAPFISLIMILIPAFQSPVIRIFAWIALPGLMVYVASTLNLFRKIHQTRYSQSSATNPIPIRITLFILIPLLLLLVAFGIFPDWFSRWITHSIQQFASLFITVTP